MNEDGRPAFQLFVVEDHQAMRYALVRMIDRTADLQVCGQAGSAEEALPLARWMDCHRGQPHSGHKRHA